MTRSNKRGFMKDKTLMQEQATNQPQTVLGRVIANTERLERQYADNPNVAEELAIMVQHKQILLDALALLLPATPVSSTPPSTLQDTPQPITVAVKLSDDATHT